MSAVVGNLSNPALLSQFPPILLCTITTPTYTWLLLESLKVEVRSSPTVSPKSFDRLTQYSWPNLILRMPWPLNCWIEVSQDCWHLGDSILLWGPPRDGSWPLELAIGWPGHEHTGEDQTLGLLCIYIVHSFLTNILGTIDSKVVPRICWYARWRLPIHRHRMESVSHDFDLHIGVVLLDYSILFQIPLSLITESGIPDAISLVVGQNKYAPF